MKKLIILLGLCILLMASFGSADVPTGGVSYWNFANLTDQWGSNHATNNGATSSTDYPTFNISGNSSPTSFNFDGTNDYVRTGISSFSDGDEITFSLWMYAHSFTQAHDIIGNYDRSAIKGTHLHQHTVDGQNKIRFASWIISGSNSVIKSSALNINQWYHVVASVASNGETKLWVDGVEQTDVDNSNAYTQSKFSTRQIIIGAQAYYSSCGGIGCERFFDGLIDEVQIFNRVLNETEINNLYNYGLIDGPTEIPPLSLSLLYPTNGTTYYGDYNGSIIAELSNVNGTATCSLNDSRWDLQDGPTFGNETVQFLNNTLITDRNISLFIQCNDSSDSANLSISFSSNLIPTMPTNISYNLNYNLDNPLVANASGSTDANNDTITYYYSFYNNNTLLQNWSTNSTYILNETDMFYELTIAAKAYDGTNYSDPYNITAELPDIDIYAFNTLTDAAISIYNITTEYRNYSNLSNGDIINLNYGTYNFTFIAFGYDDKTIEVTIIGDRNITGLLAQFYTFNIFREATATPFNTNETISTAVQYFCAEETVTYQFNVSANQNSAYFPVGCDWQFIKLDIIYATDSYYRAMMPAATEEVVNFYVLDLNNDLGVQVIFKLDDLIGDYTDGNLILLKAINGTNQVMHKQPFDAEQRVVSYLLKDGYYILKVEQADGTGVKTLGYIIAEAAAQKTITLPVFNWVPEVRVGDSISWSWENSTENTVRLIYSDTEKNTQSIKFTVYNGSNRSQALFTTTEIGVSDATFSYLGEENQSYYACFEAFEGYLGNLGEYCKEFTVFYKIPTPPGYTDSEWQILTAWICIIFLVVILLSLSGFPEVSLMMVAISMYIMKSMGLLNLTAPGLGILLDLLVVIIGVMAAFVWWKKHVVAK